MIIKGVLDVLSDGMKSVLCFTDRAYIKINGKRITRISTSDIIDNVLQENLEKNIEISKRRSLLFGNVIYSVKEENGEVTKIGFINMFMFSFLRLILWGFILIIPILVCQLAFSEDSIMAWLPFFFFFCPVISLIRDISSRNKLK